MIILIRSLIIILVELSIDSRGVIGVFEAKCNVQAGLACGGKVMGYILIILIAVSSEIIGRGLMRTALYLYYVMLYYFMLCFIYCSYILCIKIYYIDHNNN